MTKDSSLPWSVEGLDADGRCQTEPGKDSTVLLKGRPSEHCHSVDDDIDEAIEHEDEAEKYAILAVIAKGGMGSVMRALDRTVHRQVAMKINRRPKDGIARARFLTEARIAAQLEHPNIIPVYDIGSLGLGQDFFTMQLVQGRTLEVVLKTLKRKDVNSQAKWPLSRLLQVFVSVCNGIEYAHDRGVIHRDLKPGNIMIGDYGETMVMDWGLAKVGATREAKRSATEVALDRRRPDPMVTTDQTQVFATAEAEASRDLVAPSQQKKGTTSIRREAVTVEGDITGTPWYMSPEQARGEIARIDERSDIYALGSILYQILTMRPPVRGDSVEEVIRNVADGHLIAPEAPEPGKRLPKALLAVLEKALALDRDARYGSVASMRRDIERYLESRLIESAPPESALSVLLTNNPLAAIIFVTLVACCGGAAYALVGWFLG